MDNFDLPAFINYDYDSSLYVNCLATLAWPAPNDSTTSLTSYGFIADLKAFLKNGVVGESKKFSHSGLKIVKTCMLDT